MTVNKNLTFENLENFDFGENNLESGSEIIKKLYLLFQRYGQSINEENTDQQFTDRSQKSKEINITTQPVRVLLQFLHLNYKRLG